MEPRPLDFFVSYAGPDRDWAEWAAWQLQDAGHTVELDVWDWAVGANFVVRMSDALTRARRVVALFSAAYFEPRRFTRDEWTAVVAVARADPDRLVPLLIEPLPRETVPAVLRPLVTVDLYGLTPDRARQTLLGAVSRTRAVPAQEPGFPGGAAPRATSPSAPADPVSADRGHDDRAPADRGHADPVRGAAVRAPAPAPSVPAGSVPAASSPVPGSLAGVYPTDGRILSSPAVAGGLVLVGSADGLLHAVDREAMTRVWAVELDGGPVHSSPAVDGEWVYAGAGDGVHRLRLDRGTRDAVLVGEPVHSRPLTDRRTVYAMTEGGRLVAVPEADPGATRWRWTPGGPGEPVHPSVPRSSPFLAFGTVLVGTAQGDLLAVDAATGEPRWSRRIGGRVSSSPLAAGGVVYVGSDDHHVWALDLADGATVWTHETGGPVLSSPAVSCGVLYVGANDGSLYALDAATGARRWACPTDRGILGTPLVHRGTVYVAGYDGRLHTMDAGSGRRGWHFTTGGPLVSSPALADGVVYVGSTDGRLYAVHA